MPKLGSGAKLSLAIAAVVVAGAQLVPVERTNPPVESDLGAPADVREILVRSCYDCHSHETNWPWYAWVAPTSWLVAYDVGEARSELNFSKWKSYPRSERGELLLDMLDEIDEGEMPLWPYLLLHPEVRISPAERETLGDWIGGASDTQDGPRETLE
jgi:hypothetical protein